MMSMRERIKTGREIAGLSVAGLSERTGIHKASLYDYECGIRNPTLDKAIQIADALGVSLDWLCEREDAKSQQIVRWAQEAVAECRLIKTQYTILHERYDKLDRALKRIRKAMGPLERSEEPNDGRKE